MLFLKLLFFAYLIKDGVCLIMLLMGKKGMYKKEIALKDTTLSVDILLPMYNEEPVLVKTIENLLQIDYPAFSIIAVDDGSSDNSLQLINYHFGDNKRVKIVHQPNMGKSAALNNALSMSQSDIVVCIDADTLVKPDVIRLITPYFSNERVGAVAGYIKVGNQTDMLTEMQYLEYIIIQNFERIVFEPLGGILVVPGALGAFRRSAVEAVGGFASDTIAEDCDITIKLLCKGFLIRNAPHAIAYTEAPDTAGKFLRQRVRWMRGLVQSLADHWKDLLYQPNKMLAFVIVPYTWLFRVIFPFFLAVADYYFIYSLVFTELHGLWPYYPMLVLLDALSSYFLLVQSGEKFSAIKAVFLKVILLKHLTFFVFIAILRRWMGGSLKGWDKLPRQGNVELD